MGRVVVALGLAAVVTFGLMWSMQALISVGYELDEASPRISVEFVRLRKDTAPQVKKREPPKREKPDAPPPPPELNMSKASLEPGSEVAAIAPTINPTEALGGGVGMGGGADRDVVPLVRIEPEYPMRAEQRGIEGWVTVEFTITRAGTVEDPRVVAAHPPRIFDRAALQAIRKWKYNPKIQDGTAVRRPGVQVTLMFEL
jgi:protein TonB